MTFRRPPPAYAPLTLRAIAAATTGLAEAGNGGGAFERVRSLLARHFSARAVILTDSGTAALQLALRAGGPVVALPAYCCYDVATALVGAGVRAVFYDLDWRTLSPDLASLDAALEQGARAVVVAHLFGVPVDVGAVRQRAAQAGALVIEDAAQGLGATLADAPLGSLGSLSVLSFGRGKGASVGRGGALLVTDELGAGALEAVPWRLDQGRAGWGDTARLVVQWALGRPTLYAIPAGLPFLRLGDTLYREPEPPRSPSRVAARALEQVWPLAFAEVDSRRQTASRLLEFVHTSRLLAIEPIAGAHPSHLRLPVLLPPGETPDTVPVRLGAARAYPEPLPRLPAVRDLRLPQAAVFPGATTLATRLFTLPTHSRLSERDVGALGRWISQK